MDDFGVSSAESSGSCSRGSKFLMKIHKEPSRVFATIFLATVCSLLFKTEPKGEARRNDSSHVPDFRHEARSKRNVPGPAESRRHG